MKKIIIGLGLLVLVSTTTMSKMLQREYNDYATFKVKILKDSNADKLEKKFNDFCKNNDGTIIEVKYETNVDYDSIMIYYYTTK